MNLAIVQARLGSSRLPGKVLADVAGKPMLWYVVHRTMRARFVDQVVVATPDTIDDLAIHAMCAGWNVPCVAGAEHDVLHRYLTVAELWQPRPDLIIRITADCPLIDPDVIDATIEQLRDGKIWASNIVPRTWPDGLDVEVMTAGCLRALGQFSAVAAERVHVTPALYRERDIFGEGGQLQAPIGIGDLRWTVDTQADLDWVRQVYARLPWRARWQDVLFSAGGLGVRRAA